MGAGDAAKREDRVEGNGIYSQEAAPIVENLTVLWTTWKRHSVVSFVCHRVFKVIFRNPSPFPDGQAR